MGLFKAVPITFIAISSFSILGHEYFVTRFDNTLKHGKMAEKPMLFSGKIQDMFVFIAPARMFFVTLLLHLNIKWVLPNRPVTTS